MTPPENREARRWNIDRVGDDLLICFDDHDKGEKCEYTRYVPASALTAAQQRIAELREALREYGGHLDDCAGTPVWALDPRCTCGFRAALADKNDVDNLPNGNLPSGDI